MISFKEVDRFFFPLYDEDPMNVNANSIYEIKRINNGLGGIVFEEKEGAPYIKDLSKYEKACDYDKLFNINRWRFYMAFDSAINILNYGVAHN